jgi:TRAP-type mannitol/chloroaromatic compound transport system substrate-binding protein
VGEPSSAEECAVNAKAYADLPDDLKAVVKFACDSLYNEVWTEYETKHAMALKQLVAEQEVQVRMLPDDVIEAMGKAAAEVIGELRESDDALTRKTTESFVAYRDLIGGYMTYADNGQMNARAKVLGF